MSATISSNFECLGCCKVFTTRKGLCIHLAKNDQCNEIIIFEGQTNPLHTNTINTTRPSMEHADSKHHDVAVSPFIQEISFLPVNKPSTISNINPASTIFSPSFSPSVFEDISFRSPNSPTDKNSPLLPDQTTIQAFLRDEENDTIPPPPLTQRSLRRSMRKRSIIANRSPLSTIIDRKDNIETTHNDSSSISSMDTQLANETDPTYRSFFIQKKKRKINDGLMLSRQSEFMKQQVALLKITKDASCPNYLYDQIIEWAKRSAQMGLFLTENLIELKKRDQLLKALPNLVCMEGCGPITKELVLPSTNVVASVTTLRFEETLFSMLMDTSLMDSSNLLFFDKDDPTAPPSPFIESTHVYGDITSGTYMRQAYNLHCTNNTISTGNTIPPEATSPCPATSTTSTCSNRKNVLLPIILFIDKTHTDVHGKLCQEPVSYTLGIFKRSIRNKPIAWRQMGYMPNMSMLIPATKLVTKYNKRISDHHFLLQQILKSYISVQGHGNDRGFDWDLDYCGKTYYIKFKPFILYVTGDTEGQDKLCGKYAFRGDGVQMLCRYCKVPFKKTGDPFCDISSASLICQRTIDSKISRLNQKKCSQKNELTSWLQKHSRYHLESGNAFQQVIFGTPNGISQSTPCDIMHCLQKGLHQRIKEGMLKMKSLHKEERITEGDNRQMEGKVSSLRMEDTTSKQRIFSDRRCATVDEVTSIWGFMLKHQSDRNLPTTYFPHGITKPTKINAHEEQGTLLLFCVFLCSSLAEYWLEFPKIRFSAKDRYKENQGHMGNEDLGKLLSTIEDLICYEEVLRCPEINTDSLKSLQYYIPLFLEKMKRSVSRTEGVGWNFIKFHLQLHLVWHDIPRYGSPLNFDTQVGESNHKVHVKAPAKTTQRRANLFDYQTANQLYQSVLIDSFTNSLSNNISKATTSEPSESNVCTGVNMIMIGNDLFQKKKNCMSGTIPVIWKNKQWQLSFQCWYTRTIQPKLLQINKSITDEVVHCVIGRTIHLNMSKGKQHFRADPTWVNKINMFDTFGWNDWAKLSMNREGKRMIRRGQLICFLNFVGLQSSFYIDNDVDNSTNVVEITGEQTYALCHVLRQRHDEQKMDAPPVEGDDVWPSHDESILIYRGTKENYGTPTKPNGYKWTLVPVSAIINHCICIPDIFPVRDKNMSVRDTSYIVHEHEFLCVMARERWADIFIKERCKVNQKEPPVSNGTDGNVSENN